MTGGIGSPGRDRKRAAGTPLLLGAQGGTVTSRVPSPWGRVIATTPVVAATLAASVEVTLVPVSQGVTRTVRAASSVGTMTRRLPSLTLIVGEEDLLLTRRPPSASRMMRTTRTVHAVRLVPSPRGRGSVSLEAASAQPPASVDDEYDDEHDDGDEHGGGDDLRGALEAPEVRPRLLAGAPALGGLADPVVIVVPRHAPAGATSGPR